MSTSTNDRPHVAMSHEEASALSKITAAVEVLASGHRRLEDTVGKFIEATGRRFDALAEKEQFSWGKLATFLVAGITMAGAFGAIMSMYIGTALAPLQTQNQVSINDRVGLHENVDRIYARIDAGKDARLASEKDTAVRLALLEDHDKARH